MSFLNATLAYASTLSPGSADQSILNYLTSSAVGAVNAKPCTSISAHLTTLNFQLDAQDFQHGVLKIGRENSAFIGSSNRGYFVIDTQSDAELMRDFYAHRITVEQARLDHLRTLAQQQGWAI